jgi:hypothetical protein
MMVRLLEARSFPSTIRKGLQLECSEITLVFSPFFLNAANAELYCKLGLPFVMGTTGGDREMLYKTVKSSDVYAVISPQMGKQVHYLNLTCFPS